MSSTTQKAERNRTLSSFLSLFVHHACSRASKHPQVGERWASRNRKINAAAGGPWGKNVRRTSAQPVPEACTRRDASSRSPPPAEALELGNLNRLNYLVVSPARFPLLGLLLSLGCWVRAWQKPSKDPAVKTQNVVEKVSARDPARDPTTNLARKAQGVADQRCGPGQPHKVCNNRRWSRPFSPTSRQQSPGRL